MPDTFNISDVMISYSRKDKPFIRQLDQALRASGREVWLDWEDIPATADWWQEIQAGIEGANSFLFVMTPDSVQSSVCRKELEHALAHNKRLIPVLRRANNDPLIDEQMHPALKQHNWIYIREEDNFDEAFQTLVKALATDLDHVSLHTRFLVRAREWDTKKRKNGFLLRGEDLRDGERWLAAGLKNDPPPTPLQADYIHASRRAANRFRQGIGGAMLVALVVLSFLTLRLFQEGQNTQGALELAEGREHGRETEAARAQQAADDAATQAKIALDSAATARIAEGNAQEEADNAATNAFEAQVQAATATVARGQAQIEAGRARDQANIASQNEKTAVAAAATAAAAEVGAQDSASTAISAQDEALRKGTAEAIARKEAEDNAATAVAEANRAQALQLVRRSNEALAAGDRVTALQRALLAYRLAPNLDEVRSALVGVNFQPGQTFQFTFANNIQSIESGEDCHSLVVVQPNDQRQTVNIGGSVCPTSFTRSTSPILSIAAQGNPLNQIMSPNQQWRYDLDNSTLHNIQNDQNATATAMAAPPTALPTPAPKLIDTSTTSAVFSPNSARLATGTSDGIIYLWDVANATRLERLIGHTGSILGIAFMNDGNQLISVASDHTLRVWDLKALAAMGSAVDERSNGPRAFFALSPNGKLALSWDARSGSPRSSNPPNSRIIIWDFEENNKAYWDNVTDWNDPYVYGAFSPDSRMFIYATSNAIQLHKIYTNDTTTDEEDIVVGKMQTVKKGETSVGDKFLGRATLAFSPDSKYLLVAKQDGKVELWNLEAIPTLIKQLISENGGQAQQVYFSGDGKTAFIVRGDNQIERWDVSTPETAKLIDGTQSGSLIPDTPVIYLNSNQFFTGEPSGLVRLWDTANNSVIRSFLGHTTRIQELVLNGDKSLIASLSSDQKITVWDVTTGQIIFSVLAPDILSNLQFDLVGSTANPEQRIYGFTTYKGFFSRFYYWILPDSKINSYANFVSGICTNNGIPPISTMEAGTLKWKDSQLNICTAIGSGGTPDDEVIIINPTLLPPNVIEAESGQVINQGWERENDSVASGGAYLANTSGDSSEKLLLTFTGTSVEVISIRDMGIFTVSVDGTMIEGVDSSIPGESQFIERTRIDGLSNGEHKLEIIPLVFPLGIDGFVVHIAPPSSLEAAPSTTVDLAPTSEVTVEVTSEIVAEALSAAIPDFYGLSSDGVWTLTEQGWYVSEVGDTAILNRDLVVDMTDNQPRQLEFQSLLNVFDLGGSTAAVQVSADGQKWALHTVIPSPLWENQVIDLSQYIGQSIYLRFVWFYTPPLDGQQPDSWLISQVQIVPVPQATDTPPTEEIVILPTATLTPEPVNVETETPLPTLEPTFTLEIPTETAVLLPTPTETDIPPLTFNAPIGLPFEEDFNSGTGNWSALGGWELNLIGDNGGEFGWFAFPNVQSSTLTWLQSVDLEAAQAPVLHFDYYLKSQSAFAGVEISTDTVTWTPILTITTQDIYQAETIDLSPYIGQVVYVRFVWNTPDPEGADFWVIYNLRVADAVGEAVVTPEPAFTEEVATAEVSPDVTDEPIIEEISTLEAETQIQIVIETPTPSDVGAEGTQEIGS
jgi:WD40 repeat protein